MVGRSDAARLRAVRAGLRATLAAARRGGATLLAAREEGVLAGALVASAPARWPFPSAPLGLRLRAWLAEGAAAPRFSAAFDALAALHPPVPHAYLAALGVEPGRTGRGLGRALLTRWLAELDRAGARAYLEVDRAENRAFYERAGFRVTGEVQILDLPVWLMLR